MAVLDEIDCTILTVLQERGDIPNIELARLAGLSPAATSRRVARLRLEGVIEAVRAVLIPEEVGLPIEAFILATLAEHAPEADARFAREVAAMPAVLRADSVAGAEDVLLQVAVATPADLQRAPARTSSAPARRG